MDILCVQDTWYSKQDLSGINCLYKSYHGYGVATRDYHDGLVIGHPPGGVAILWNTRLEIFIKPVDVKCDWCIAVEVTLGLKRFIIVNMYLPYHCHENEDRYLECLGTINSMLEEFDNTCYVVIGVWNPKFRDVEHSLFAKHMLNFCSDNNYNSSSKILLPVDSYTYMSETWDTQSWLDHAVTSADFHNSLQDINICYDTSDTDHIPFTLNLLTDNIPDVTDNTNSNSPRLHWDNLSDNDCIKYGYTTDNLLQYVNLPDVVYCKNVNCMNHDHVESTKIFYENIVDCLKQAGVVDSPQSNSNKFNMKPGWSEYIADLYNT